MENYYNNERKEIIKYIPKGVKRILDVGCGEGSTLEMISKIYDCEAVGVEINIESANKANKKFKDIYNFSCENKEKMDELGDFDVILLLDVLEHMIDPWAFVLNLKKVSLRQGGTLIASIPNFKNYKIMQSYIKGNFRYEEAGLFDRTHLRWFAKKNMMELFEEVGLKVDIISASNLQGKNKATIFNGLTLGIFEEYLAFQYILVVKN